MDKVYKDPKHIFRLEKLGCIIDRLFCWKSESLNWLRECVYVCTLCRIFCSFNLIINEEEFTKWISQMKWTTSSSFYIQGVLIWLFAEADLETGIWLASTLLVVSRMMCLGYWCQEERGESISVHQWVAHCCGPMASGPLKMHDHFENTLH